jgi:ATP-binding cassette, subfamily B, multidrug efflux pump
MKPTALIKPYLKENMASIAMGIACLVAVDLLSLYIPRIIKLAVDSLATREADPWVLKFCALQIVGIALLIGVFRYLWRRFLIGTSRKIEKGLRNRLFAHIQSLSASYFNSAKTGDLMAHATNDIKHIRMATGMGMVAFTDALVMGTAAIGFMLYINVRLTLFALIPMPFIVFGTKFFSKKMHRKYQSVQAAFSELTEVARERFSGIRMIKAYGLEPISLEKFHGASRTYMNAGLNLVKVTGSFFPLMMFFSNLCMVVVIGVGGRETIMATITPGDFVAFVSYIGLLTWPMMATGWVVNLIQRGKASLDRIDRILQTQPEIKSRTGAISRAGIEIGITFDRVSFSYPTKPHESPIRPLLENIDFYLPKGGFLGIVGPPGSGKTTILNLIPRLYDISDGKILVGGTDIRNYSVDTLRSLFSFMPQEPFLFAGTIAENIAFGDSEKKYSPMMAATKLAVLADTITGFPNGFDTVVGEKGIILSGGQKQRVALARALMRKAPILILDDPVSQVDAETGSRIIDNLRSLSDNKTIIMASHRLSAIRTADRIIVLEDGKINETGTHEELMATGHYYRDTFHLQELEDAV